MKSRWIGIVVTTILVASITSTQQVSAQSNHTLEWGVDVGHEITYVMQRKLLDPTFGSYLEDFAPFITEMDEGQSLIASVSHLDPIPAMINESYQMPRSNCTLIRQNDSEVIMEDMFMLVVPVGDWTFSSEMGGLGFFGDANSSDSSSNFTMFDDIEQVDTEDTWGTIIDTSFVFGIFVITIYMEMLYEKLNGTLTNMRMRVNFAGNDMIDVIFTQWYPGILLNLPPELQLLTIVLIAVTVVIVILVILYFRRRRIRKSRAQAEPAQQG